MQDKGKTQAANLLAERIAECQACLTLRGQQELKVETLDSVLLATKKVWDIFPPWLRIKLAAAQSGLVMGQLAKVLKETGVQEPDKLHATVRSLSLAMHFSVDAPEKFQPRQPLLDPIFHAMLKDFKAATDVSSMNAMDDIGMDIDALIHKTSLEESSGGLSPALVKCLETSKDICCAIMRVGLRTSNFN